MTAIHIPTTTCTTITNNTRTSRNTIRKHISTSTNRHRSVRKCREWLCLTNLEILQEHKRTNTLPPGLRINHKSKYYMDKTFRDRLENILSNASLALLETTIDYNTNYNTAQTNLKRNVMMTWHKNSLRKQTHYTCAVCSNMSTPRTTIVICNP